jgi:hypothetical protein
MTAKGFVVGVPSPPISEISATTVFREFRFTARTQPDIGTKKRASCLIRPLSRPSQPKQIVRRDLEIVTRPAASKDGPRCRRVIDTPQ